MYRTTRMHGVVTQKTVKSNILQSDVTRKKVAVYQTTSCCTPEDGRTLTQYNAVTQNMVTLYQATRFLNSKDGNPLPDYNLSNSEGNVLTDYTVS